MIVVGEVAIKDGVDGIFMETNHVNYGCPPLLLHEFYPRYVRHTDVL